MQSCLMEIIKKKKILFAKLQQKVLTQTPLAEMLGIIDMYSRVTMHVIALRASLQYVFGLALSNVF